MAAGLASRSRRAGHRLGLPAQLLGADPGRVHRPRQPAAAGRRATSARVGRPDRRPGCCASATCAASCPARAGRTPSRTAPTRSATLAESPHVGHQRAHRAARRASPTGCCCRSTGCSPTASRTGWPAPPWRCCAATSSRCGSSSRGSPGWPPTAGARASYDDRDPYLESGNAEAFLRALYLQLALGAQAARGPLRPAAGAGGRAARRPTRTYLQARDQPHREPGACEQWAA